jgi:RNA polymerase sigma factor (TIGR02999 family)
VTEHQIIEVSLMTDSGTDPAVESTPSRVPLTELIRQASGGDEVAFQAIFHATYEDLRKIARSRLAGHVRGTLLDTTALVHESYLRLAKMHELSVTDRAHFFRYAGQVMRSIVVDFARMKLAERRGSGVVEVTMNSRIDLSSDSEGEDVLRVHEAMATLAAIDPQLVEIVEMRYFAGLTEREIADALQITDRTVRRRWEKARLLLAAELGLDQSSS